jgi:hypothetical protein
MNDYDAEAGQNALNLFHRENNLLKEAIANAATPEALKALHEKRDQIISIAIGAINKAEGEKK